MDDEITHCPHCRKRIKSHPFYKQYSAYWAKQSAYPYTLYHAILGEPIKNVTPEMGRGLEYALSTLTDIEREMLLRLYKDRPEGKKPPTRWTDNGEMCPAFPIYSDALRKLRDPAMMEHFMPESADVKEED